MKKAWLIINKYHISKSFDKLKTLFFESAKKHSIQLKEFNNVEIMNIMSKQNYDKPDFVLFWDKDVKLAAYIESEGIKVFNSSEAIRNCDDKALTYLKLHNKNVLMPKTIFSPLIYYHDIYKDDEFINFAISAIGFPLVFKECFGSFGMQVYLINNKDELVNKIKDVNIWPFIMQEYVKESHGKDLRLYVVGDKVVAAMKRENLNGDFRANIEIGGKGTNYTPNNEQVSMAINVTKELGLSFSGVDILFGKNNVPILCEINSNAYFVNINEVSNVNIEDYIFEYILSNI